MPRRLETNLIAYDLLGALNRLAMTQVELAQQLGYSETSVYRYCKTGKVPKCWQWAIYGIYKHREEEAIKRNSE